MSEPDSAHRDNRALARAGPWVFVSILLVYLVLAVGSAHRKSVTVDELGHLPSGLYFLYTGDVRYAALNPPLINALSAFPVLFLDLERPIEPPPPSDDVFSFWSNGYHFQERHRVDYRRVFAAARWAPILVVAGLGVLVYCFARRLSPGAPELAGLLAAGFVCLSPNVIAHARLVGTDTGTAFAVLLAVWGLRRMLKEPCAATSLLCGAALGLAQLTKFYAVLLYPLFLVIALTWHVLSPPPRPPAARLLAALAGALVTSLLVLDSGYLWSDVGVSLASLELKSGLLTGWQGSPFGSIPVPLPAAYLRAFDGQLFEVASDIPSYLFGDRFTGGHWTFYPATLALKTPIGLFVAFGLALFLSLTRPGLPRRETVLLLAYPAALFVLLSLSPGRPLGDRALLSAAPLVWLWAGGTIGRAGAARWPRALAAVALLATLVASIATYPNYLSYSNAFFGGSEATHRYASDANVDIGQDLVGLADYLADAHAGQIQLLYFGSVDPALYGVDFEIPEAQWKPGLLAVSVSLYRMAYPMYRAGALYTVGPVDPDALGDPIAHIGGSIHVYRLGP
ncbi:MAG: ArnT family glycosyltransferase [Myxococcota bacterium]